MSENLDKFTAALGIFRSVTARVPEGAWDNQSCCSEWTAREAAGHATWVIKNTTSAAAGTEPPAAQPEADVVGDDPAATVSEVADAAERALAAADLSTVIPTPFGEMPIDSFLGIIWIDTLIHAWDVADAAGIDHGIEPDLAVDARAAIEPMVDAMRSFGAFGPPQEEPADDPVGAFAAYTGRVPVNA